MNNSGIESLTHSQLIKLIDPKNLTGLEDKLIIIENDKPDIEPFKYPCRIDSLVAIVCLEGNMIININLNEYHIHPGMMIVNMPENIVQLKSDENCSFYGISVTRSFFETVQINLSDIIPVYSQVRNEPCLYLSQEEHKVFCEFISLIKLISQPPESPKKMDTLQNLGAAFIWQLYDTILHYTPIVKSESKKNRQEIIFSKFLALLSQYHMQERSVTFYAEQLCITPKYFSTLVKNQSGKSAAQWIDDYVILEAKNLLKYSEMSIQEIAYQLNFSTQSFFGKYFKHQTGMSPTQYRIQA